MTMNSQRSERNWKKIAVVSLYLLFLLLPIYWLLNMSFKTNQEILSTFSLWPQEFTLDNYATIFSDPTWYSGYINSMIYVVMNTVIALAVALPAAYAFSRLRFTGRRAGLLTLILVQMFPQLLALVAIYALLVNIGNVFPFLGIGSQLALIMVYLGGALGANTYLMYGFFNTIPKGRDEAAKIDGATHTQIFYGIILRLAAPILAVIGLLAFIGTSSDFVLANIILTKPESKTLAVGLYMYVSDQFGQRWTIFAAGAVLAAVPIVALFLYLQKYIVSGLTGGAVKG